MNAKKAKALRKAVREQPMLLDSSYVHVQTGKDKPLTVRAHPASRRGVYQRMKKGG